MLKQWIVDEKWFSLMLSGGSNPDKVLLEKVTAITLEEGRMTNSRRVSPVQQVRRITENPEGTFTLERKRFAWVATEWNHIVLHVAKYDCCCFSITHLIVESFVPLVCLHCSWNAWEEVLVVMDTGPRLFSVLTVVLTATMFRWGTFPGFEASRKDWILMVEYLFCFLMVGSGNARQKWTPSIALDIWMLAVRVMTTQKIPTCWEDHVGWVFASPSLTLRE